MCPSLLGASVLGDSLCSLGNGVLGQLAGQKQTYCGLDFPGGDGGTPVVMCQTAGLGSDALEDVVNKAVHDGHGLAGDAGIGMDLLEDFVDVDRVRFPPPPLPLLVSSACGFGLAGGLLGALGCWLGWHSSYVCVRWIVGRELNERLYTKMPDRNYNM